MVIQTVIFARTFHKHRQKKTFTKGFSMSPSQPFNKEFIQDLAKMLSDCDLTEIEIEHDKSKLRVAPLLKMLLLKIGKGGIISDSLLKKILFIPIQV